LLAFLVLASAKAHRLLSQAFIWTCLSQTLTELLLNLLSRHQTNQAGLGLISIQRSDGNVPSANAGFKLVKKLSMMIFI